jgi:hypothetical protein
MAQFLVNRRPEALQAKDSPGRLSLHVAFDGRWTRFRAVRCMVDASPASLHEEEDDEGDLPLHAAAREAGLKVSRFLVKRRPESLQAMNKRGERPADVARQWCGHDDDDDDDDNDRAVGEFFAQWEADLVAVSAISSGSSESDDDS